MELLIVARFHALDGREEAVAETIREVAGPTRIEPGCLDYAACRCVRDPRLFFIYSRWVDRQAFETHAELPHTVRFLERVEQLIDHPLDVTKAHSIIRD